MVYTSILKRLLGVLYLNKKDKVCDDGSMDAHMKVDRRNDSNRVLQSLPIHLCLYTEEASRAAEDSYSRSLG